jgi:flagellar hook-associated protein 3 FlgL
MRITELGMATSRFAWIEKNRSEMASVEQEIATGRRIQRPSDHPADTSRVLRHDQRLQRVTQFERNADNARLWLDGADSALQSVSNNLERARTLAIQSGNATLGPVEARALADDIRSIADELIAASNAKVSGRSIFAGTADTPDAYDQFGSYLGDYGQVLRTIDTTEIVEVGLRGPEVFGVSNGADPLNGNAFEVLQALADAVEIADGDTVRDGIEAVDVVTARVGTSQGRIGAISQQVDAVLIRHSGERLATEAHVSQLQDVDIADAIIRLRSAEASYEASLTASSRALSRSLLDFLR